MKKSNSQEIEINDFNVPIPTEDYKLKKKQMDIGVLGKFFGAGDNCSRNIAGLTILVLLLIIIYGIVIKEYTIMDKLFPGVTLALGYLFGNYMANK